VDVVGTSLIPRGMVEDGIICAEGKICYKQQCVSINFFRCTPGYVFDSSSDGCVDINECSGRNNCSDVCVNTAGGFYCTCKSGYELSSDQITCIGELTQIRETEKTVHAVHPL